MNRTLETVSLHEIMAVRAGTVDPSRHPDEVFELYSIPAFDNGVPDVLAGSEIGSSKQVVEPGDVLLSKIVPHIRRAWVVGPKNGSRIIASSEWIVFRSERFVPEYLRHVLMGDPFHAQFMKTVSGVGGSLLRARPAHVAAIKIPLPSRTEQRRIADILDEADALRRKRAEAIRLANDLVPSLFYEMFGDPVTATRNATTIRLNELCDVISGFAFKSEWFSEVGTPVIRISDIYDGRVSIKDAMRIPTTVSGIPQNIVAHEGDLLMALSGATTGKMGFVGSDQAGALVNQRVAILREKQKGTARYLQAILADFRVMNRLLSTAGGSAQANLSPRQLADLPITKPPHDKLESYRAALVDVDQITGRQNESAAELDNLFHSLLQRAFRGEL